ncbi:MAG: PAS domain-containing protein [Promethearchaeota archaeon]
MRKYQKNLHDRDLRLILDTISDELMILNKDFTIKDVNKTFCLNYNVNKEQIIGNKCYKITHGINNICKPPQCKCPVEEVLKTGDFNESVHSHHINENEIYLEILAYPIKNKNGEIEQIVKIGKDVSELRKIEILLKNSEEKFRNLVENFPYSIILLDSRKLIYDCNSSAELYLNHEKNKLKNSYFFDIIQLNEQQVDTLNEIFQNVIDFGLSEIIEFEFINKNNKKSWLEAFFSRVTIENNKFIQIMLQDITERVLAEMIIKDENKRLRTLDKIKKNMTTKTSEQLKNPLIVLSNATDILLNTYREKIDLDVIRLLELIKSESEKSLGLVGKIVNISKIDSNKLILDRQTESLAEIILELVNSLSDEIKLQKIKTNLNHSEDLYSEIDKLRIKQVMEEIITYIRKNNNEQDILINLKRVNGFGNIEIKCQLSQHVEKNLLQELAVSKQIVELHCGKIHIESRDNENQHIFKILLPLKEWKDSLIHLYIIYKSGVPLFDHAFQQLEGYNNSTLISGGIIGLMTILKSILKGETQIKSIDHGDRTIIFNSNCTNDIVFVLIVKENMNILKQKLEDLIKEFDANYQNLIENIEHSCSEQDNWKDLIFLVQKYFSKKSLEGNYFNER